MKIMHDKDWITIVVMSDDWDRHLAQKMIAHIKALGKGNYFYQFHNKTWKIRNTPEYKEYFRKFKADWIKDHKDQPIQLRLDWDEFDSKKWLDDTFGPDKDPPIAVSWNRLSYIGLTI